MSDHTIQLSSVPPRAESELLAEVETSQAPSSSEQGVADVSTGHGESTKVPSVHVVVDGDNWQVKESGNPQAIFEHALKKEALVFATAHAKSLKTELFIHGADGKMQCRNSYGNDAPGGG